MKLNHTFTVPGSVSDAWPLMRDVRRIAPCMPGAALDEVDGDTFTGRMEIKVGPIKVAYAGEASFAEVDEDRHRAVIVASGRERAGSGSVTATITADLREAPAGSTTVDLTTDLSITGRPAQFGSRLIGDVGDRVLAQFASCLADELGNPTGAPGTRPSEPLALFRTAAPALLPYVAPVAGIAAGLIAVLLWRRAVGLRSR